MTKHPKGFYLIATLESLNGFRGNGTMSILSLFMISNLMLTMPFTSKIFGFYIGSTALTALLGGYIADRYLGYRKSIILGSLLLITGELILSLSASLYNPSSAMITHSNLIWTQQEIYFLIGLILLCLGGGFFSSNMPLMRFLYETKDDRLDSAFLIAYYFINFGGLLSPIIIGAVTHTQPELFKYGFLIAGICMAINLIIFLIFKNKIIRDSKGNEIGIKPIYKEKSAALDEDILDESILKKMDYNDKNIKVEKENLKKLSYEEKQKIIEGSLTKVEKHRIYVIFIISLLGTFFWSAYGQAETSLTFFTNSFISRTVAGFTIPTEWFLSLNPLFIVLLCPIFLIIINKLHEKKYRLSIPVKMSLGLIILSIGFFIFAIPANNISLGANSISMIWIILLYFLLTISELLMSPIGLSTVSKLSPLKFTSLFLGVWTASIALSYFLGGFLSALYPDPSLPTPYLLGIIPINGFLDFFLIFASLTLIGGILMFIFRNKIIKWTHGVE